MDIKELVQKQRKYFFSGATLPYRARMDALRRLGKALDEYDAELKRALYRDLHKSASESYMTELSMTKAERFVTPVTLELGGKSPCIVDKTANISKAARRIVFGKLLNSGQTCVAPDYLLVHKDVKQVLFGAMKRELVKMLGEHPLENGDYLRDKGGAACHPASLREAAGMLSVHEGPFDGALAA